MAKKNNSARKHSSPGLYFSDSVVNYATKSLGITSLGVVGETLRGRAFEPMTINDWAEYTYNFGGTSTEKYRGSQYPKYELPYIAQSYLEQSHNLKVVRVLGLSGVNAGPAWVVTAKATGSDYDNMVVLVIRSRGEHQKAAFVSPADPSQGICDPVYEYDGIHYYAKEVELEPSATLNLAQDCTPWYNKETGNFTVNSLNYGTFTIKVTLNDEAAETEHPNVKYYSVTLNPTDKNYIYKVIGGEPEKGNAEVYVEELYDVALKQLVDKGTITEINSTPVKFENVNIVPEYEDVYDLLTDPLPTRKMLGKRYLFSSTESMDGEDPINVRYSTDNGNSWGAEIGGENGMIYTVMSEVDPETGKRSYFYGAYVGGTTTYEYTSYDASLYGEPNNYRWYTECEAEANGNANLQNLCPLTDQTASSIIAGLTITNESPLYYKFASTNPKIIDWSTQQTVFENQSVCACTSVSRVGDNDAIALDFGSFVNRRGQTVNGTIGFRIRIKYDSTYLQFNNSVIPSGDTQYYHLDLDNTVLTYWNTSNPNDKWSIMLKDDINWADSFSAEYPDNASAFAALYRDPSLIKVEFYDPKSPTALSVIDDESKLKLPSMFVKKVANYTTGDRNHRTEQLQIYNYGQQVENNKFTNCVYVVSEKSFYINDGSDVKPITLDFNNYKEQYRWATSPWIVSELKGSAENIELNRLFRFHAISDGSTSTTEFKISIENIDPTTGKFDVVVRDFYDSDLSVNPYEKFLSCDLVPGSPNYISLMIGSTDGIYNSKSRYITVEVIENDVTKSSIPAGFLGYPIRRYDGFAITNNGGTVTAPYFEYNTNIDDEIKARKQYFGVSDLVGVDEDIFKYKGVEAYDGAPEGLTPCFHLDARILNGKPNADGVVTESGIQQTVAVDGVTGYTWVTVNRNNTLPSYGIEPRISDETSMIGTIYENKAYRKFTVAMYGGWDGWDYYRTVRSNGDEYRYKEYKGAIDRNSGYGTMFSVYNNPESLGFNADDKVITSDYYAYLAGAKLLGNPKSITVNVLATPGIDYVNNKALVDDVIDVVEDERGDLIYVITTPDKPSGAGDSIDEMYTAQDAVYNLEDSDIDSNHCCTYYPWVKYWDGDNNQYVFLPLTRDVVRSIAYTDNVKFSWYANAGWNRGNIPNNAQPRKKLTLNEQDTLYDGRINFVNSFAEEGNKIWGDKNLQIDDNLLNRISKRRLLLRIRTMLQNACIGLIFDPNDLTMSQTVRSAVTKVLDDVKTGRGITDYKIEIDDSPETRDQLGLNVTYHIKPIQALEWINFSSVLTPEGMVWN